MHNFGRGMWRRISDHQKQQEISDIQTNRLLHYFQTQKQRAFDAYSRIAISNEKKEVKENDVSDNYVIVEAVLSEPEPSVISKAEKEEPSVISEAEPSVLTSEAEKEEPSVISKAEKEEPSVLSEEPSVLISEAESSVISKAEPSVLTSEAEKEEPSVLTSEPEPVVSAPISKSTAKKRRKK